MLRMVGGPFEHGPDGDVLESLSTELAAPQRTETPTEPAAARRGTFEHLLPHRVLCWQGSVCVRLLRTNSCRKKFLSIF
jgi:hypothetical protein